MMRLRRCAIHGTIWPSGRTAVCTTITGAHPMPDIVPLLIAAAVFALFFAYVPLCAKI
jgi:hypothetical protein